MQNLIYFERRIRTKGMWYIMKEEKNTRIGIRISEKKKKQFYEICEMHGLCPSVLINRWIHRFILNSKKNKIDFKEIYSASSERLAGLKEYKES